MSLGLLAPAAVSVELRIAEGRGSPRVFRLSRALGEAGLELESPAPFEPDRPVEVRFALPGAEEAPLVLRGEMVLIGDESEAEGEAGAAGVAFVDPPSDVRRAIATYVLPRLGLPPPA